MASYQPYYEYWDDPSPPATSLRREPLPPNAAYKFFVPGFPLEAVYLDFFHTWIDSLDEAEPPEEQVLQFDTDGRLIENHSFVLCGCEEEDCILCESSDDEDDDDDDDDDDGDDNNNARGEPMLFAFSPEREAAVRVVAPVDLDQAVHELVGDPPPYW